jgi:hypothetical protein
MATRWSAYWMGPPDAGEIGIARSSRLVGSFKASLYTLFTISMEFLSSAESTATTDARSEPSGPGSSIKEIIVAATSQVASPAGQLASSQALANSVVCHARDQCLV